MLQNTLRSYPTLSLRVTVDGFGVWLDGVDYVKVVYSGRWTVEELRGFLVLFAAQLAVEPERLIPNLVTTESRDGASSTVEKVSRG